MTHRLAASFLLAVIVSIATEGSATAGPHLLTNGSFGAGLSGFTSDYAVPNNQPCLGNQPEICQAPASGMFVNTVPEPASAAALIVGMTVIIIIRIRRRRRGGR